MASACPTLEQLLEFHAEEDTQRLPEEIRDHLQRCTRCEATLGGLKSLGGWLRTGSVVTAERLSCLDDIRLGAFLEKSLGEQELRTAEAHLARCDDCLARLVALHAAVTAVREAPVLAPPDVLARAKALVKAPRTLWGLRVPSWGRIQPAYRWAGAVAAILLVFVIGEEMLRRPSELPTVPSEIRAPGEGVAGAFQPTAPAPEARVPATRLAFQWSAMPEAVRYELSVIDDDGDVVWEATTRETTAAPSPTTLVPGDTYYWRITAWLSDGRAMQSPLVRFTVVP
jgi:hypothetical protein